MAWIFKRISSFNLCIPYVARQIHTIIICGENKRERLKRVWTGQAMICRLGKVYRSCRHFHFLRFSSGAPFLCLLICTKDSHTKYILGWFRTLRVERDYFVNLWLPLYPGLLILSCSLIVQTRRTNDQPDCPSHPHLLFWCVFVRPIPRQGMMVKIGCGIRAYACPFTRPWTMSFPIRIAPFSWVRSWWGEGWAGIFFTSRYLFVVLCWKYRVRLGGFISTATVRSWRLFLLAELNIYILINCFSSCNCCSILEKINESLISLVPIYTGSSCKIVWNILCCLFSEFKKVQYFYISTFVSSALLIKMLSSSRLKSRRDVDSLYTIWSHTRKSMKADTRVYFD